MFQWQYGEQFVTSFVPPLTSVRAGVSQTGQERDRVVCDTADVHGKQLTARPQTARHGMLFKFAWLIRQVLFCYCSLARLKLM